MRVSKPTAIKPRVVSRLDVRIGRKDGISDGPSACARGCFHQFRSFCSIPFTWRRPRILGRISNHRIPRPLLIRQGLASRLCVASDISKEVVVSTDPMRSGLPPGDRGSVRISLGEIHKRRNPTASSFRLTSPIPGVACPPAAEPWKCDEVRAATFRNPQCLEHPVVLAMQPSLIANQLPQRFEAFLADSRSLAIE